MKPKQAEKKTVRVLFVDDEPNVLDGLRRMLRDKRREWAMTFVASGEEALQIVLNDFVDIVVSDLRMPGLDGVSLLKEVRKKSPETVRIALSGYADRSETLRAVTQIHQFLSKPCDPELLKYRLDRAVELGRLLTDSKLKQLVSQMETLPSLAPLFDDVLEKLEDGGASLGEIGESISHDPGLSTKVLQLVNSAFVGLPQLVGDPVQATVLLGLDTVETLVLSVKVFEEFERNASDAESVSEVWEHCVAVARLSKRIALAEAADEQVAEQAFLSGLLHDTGKLVYATNMPSRYLSVVRLGRGDAAITDRVERNVIGASHGVVAAYLVGLWGFTDEVLEAIAMHHQPSLSSTGHFTPLTAVHAANVLVRHHQAPHSGNTKHIEFDLDYLDRLGLRERVPLWDEMYRQTTKKETHT